MSNEEQQEEIEALQSIFPDCFVEISNVSYKIKVEPCGEGAGVNHVGVYLVVNLPAEYPACEPELSIEVDKGLSKKQADEIADVARSCAAENVGMPSVYMVSEAVKDWLVENNVAGQDGSMYADMMRRMQQKEAEEKKKLAKKEEALRNASAAAATDGDSEIAVDKEEIERLRRRALGTLVTKESFAAWQRKFDDEMKDLAAANGIVTAASAAPIPVAAAATTSTTTSHTFASAKCVFNFNSPPLGSFTLSPSELVAARAAEAAAASSSSSAAATSSTVFTAAANAAAASTAKENATAVAARHTGKQLFLMKEAKTEFAHLDGNEDLLAEAMEKALAAMGDEEDEEDEEDEDYDGSDDDDDESEDEEA